VWAALGFEGEIMSKVSLKGILVGGFISVIAPIFLSLIAIIIYTKIPTPNPQTPINSMNEFINFYNSKIMPPFVILGLAMNLFFYSFAVVGGYISAKLAKKNELLNSTLSSWPLVLLVVIGAIKDQNVQLTFSDSLFIFTLLFFTLGGYIRLKQVTKYAKP